MAPKIKSERKLEIPLQKCGGGPKKLGRRGWLCSPGKGKQILSCDASAYFSVLAGAISGFKTKRLPLLTN